MKAILLAIALFFASFSHAFESREEVAKITLKKAVALRVSGVGSGDEFSTSASFCVNLKSGQATGAQNCQISSDNKVRACEVIVYTLNPQAQEAVLPAGTEFEVVEQKGPAIGADWSTKTSYLKVFSALKGSTHQEPRLVISCIQSKSGLMAPKIFTLAEIQRGLSTLIELE